MNVVRERYSPDFHIEHSVVTVGFFDGVHCGHLRLIMGAREEARARGLPLVVVSFEVHPMAVIAPSRVPALLSGRTGQLRALGGLQVDTIYYLRFDRERAQESPEAFVRDMLVGRLGAKVVVVGENFTFGHRGEGTVDTLNWLAPSYGFETLAVGLEVNQIEPVSSSRIRAHIEAGEIARANELLGRTFEVEGVVVHGDRRGRELGFPTANVRPRRGMVLPGDGIYGGWAWVGPARYRAAISVGTRPTYYDKEGAVVTEAYLLDFQGDLYGQFLRLALVAKVREQQAFDGSAELIAQMKRDLDVISNLVRL